MSLSACGPSASDADAPELGQGRQSEQEEQLRATVSDRVLLLASTVVNGLSSQEALAATRAGMTVEVVTAAQWGAKTRADFAAYRALILGDARCASMAAVNAAIANRDVWGPAINGNVILAGAAPVFFTGTSGVPGPMTRDAVAFAVAKPDKTGAYISLSCYYTNYPTPTASPGQAVTLLDQLGSFSVLRTTNCYNTAHIAARFIATPSITDANLSGWSCSAMEVFDSFPAATFTPLVIARDPSETVRLAGSMSLADGSHGPAYVLAKGATPLLCGNGVVDAPEECDDGPNNGAAGEACSGTCHLHWCGDGTVDPGEQCDGGPANGDAGPCSATCTLLSTGRPPVARCKPLALSAALSCGVAGSIDDGSFDPDNDMAGCTQSPAGPYGPGTTDVTLTCRDTAGLTSSCSATVTVADDTPPSITCPADMIAEECINYLGHVVLPGPPSAADNCGLDYIEPLPEQRDRYFMRGTNLMEYTATDLAGNTASCEMNVTVFDTKPPEVVVNGQPSLRLECGLDAYVEEGATANDRCVGDVSDTLTVSGSVDTRRPGRYTLTYRATDLDGHVGEGQRDVRVEDATPPRISLLGADPQLLECGVDEYHEAGATAEDACSGDLTASIVMRGEVNTAVPGRYSVVYTATDGSGLAASTVRNVEVVAAPPRIVIRPAAQLWPPDHRMLGFHLSDCAEVRVTCGGPIDLDQRGRITSIYSDEPEDARGGGDGDTLNDIVLTGPSSFQLRAERQGGGTGRAYGVGFLVTDASGATLGNGFCRYLVPRDTSGRPVVDEGPSHGYTVYAR